MELSTPQNLRKKRKIQAKGVDKVMTYTRQSKTRKSAYNLNKSNGI